MAMILHKAEAEALNQVLEPLLAWVNHGAGVDAYLGDNADCLLLDPDDDANTVLCNLLARIQREYGLVKGMALEASL